MKTRLALAGIVLLAVATARAADGEGRWKLHPAVVAGTRQKITDYTPTFDKHFTVAGETLTGRCALGREIYTKAKCRAFDGIGRVWATRADWPTDTGDLEMTFDYRWYWKQPPPKQFGDFPDLNVGFRLNDAGEGYVVAWGFLGQVRVYRLAREDGAFARIVGEGHFGRGSAKGVKVRILAAGPVIKVKFWIASKPEPKAWTVEAMDDFAPADEKRFRSGAVAVGFIGRNFYDTAEYEFKNITVRKLPEAEAKKVAFYDPETAPPAATTPTKHIPLGGPMKPLKGAAALAGFAPSENLKVEATDDGLVLTSKDGKPAFLWVKSTRPSWSIVKKFALRATAGGEARPLLAQRIVTEGKTQLAYFDPQWRKGVAAVLRDSDRHTANSSRAEFKPGTSYDLTYWSGHWLAWQLAETDKPETGIRFRARPSLSVHRKSKTTLGVGVVGKGAVTLKAVFEK